MPGHRGGPRMHGPGPGGGPGMRSPGGPRGGGWRQPPPPPQHYGGFGWGPRRRGCLGCCTMLFLPAALLALAGMLLILIF